MNLILVAQTQLSMAFWERKCKQYCNLEGGTYKHLVCKYME